MSDMPANETLAEALAWCLEHGVKAVDWGTTGYWKHEGVDGYDIMPPARLHVALDAARTIAITKQKATEDARKAELQRIKDASA